MVTDIAVSDIMLPRSFDKVTTEPVIFLYFLAIYLLYSVIQPLVLARVCLSHLAGLADSGLTCGNIRQLNSSLAMEVNQQIIADTDTSSTNILLQFKQDD